MTLCHRRNRSLVRVKIAIDVVHGFITFTVTIFFKVSFPVLINYRAYSALSITNTEVSLYLFVIKKIVKNMYEIIESREININNEIIRYYFDEISFL